MFGRPDSLEGMKEEFIDLNKTFCTGFQPPQQGSEKLFIRLFQVRKKTWSQYHCYCSHDLIPWLPIFTFVSSQFLLFNGLGNLPDLLLLEYSPPLPTSPPRLLILKGLLDPLQIGKFRNWHYCETSSSIFKDFPSTSFKIA